MAVYHDVASCYSTIRHHHHHHHHPGRGLRLVWQLTDATVTIQSYSIQRPTNGRPTNVYVELENCKRQLAKTAACPSRGPDESIPERSRSLVAELLIRCLCSDTESIFFTPRADTLSSPSAIAQRVAFVRYYGQSSNFSAAILADSTLC